MAKFVLVVLLGMVGVRVVTFVTDMTRGIDRSGRTKADNELCMLHMPDGWNRETQRIENAWMPWFRPGPFAGFEITRVPGFFAAQPNEPEFRAMVDFVRRRRGTPRGTIEPTTVMGHRVHAWEFEAFEDGLDTLHRVVAFDVGAMRRILDVWIVGPRSEARSVMLREVTESIRCREPRSR